MQKSAILRLRNDEIVVGYLRQEGSRSYYSRDMSGWSGEEIRFRQTDRCTGYRDKNRRYLFEHDIIRYQAESESIILEIELDELLDKFYLREQGEESFYSEEWLEDHQYSGKIEWLSYTFIQNE
jgi:hypothetical protein